MEKCIDTVCSVSARGVQGDKSMWLLKGTIVHKSNPKLLY